MFGFQWLLCIRCLVVCPWVSNRFLRETPMKACGIACYWSFNQRQLSFCVSHVEVRHAEEGKGTRPTEASDWVSLSPM